jgi:hypothetical protein
MNSLLNYGQEHLFLLGLISVGTFLGSLIAIPVIVVRLPEDYFVQRRKVSQNRSLFYYFMWSIFTVLKNGIGFLFLAAGIAMLFLPGQGLITILIGLSLLDFPGKHTLQDYFVRVSSVQKTMNWIRKKYGRSYLRFPA